MVKNFLLATQRSDDRGRTTEGGGQTTDDRRQRSEVGGERIENRKKKIEERK